jgi:DNA-binding transcriptional LysR family regulator
VIDPGALGWDDLRTFLQVAHRGTLPEAARVLGISPATAGRRVQRLEQAVGAPLFDRLPNRLVLTHLGQELAEVGTAMQQGAAAVAQRANLRMAPADAPVRVTATGSVSLFLAANALRLTELAAAEGVTVSVTATKAALDMASGEADVALRMRRLPECGPLAGRRLGRVAFTVYVACCLWDRVGQPGNDWRSVGVVGLTETARSPSQSQWLDEAAATCGASIRLRLGEVAMRHQAVRDGAGASLLPYFLGDGDPALVRLIPPPSPLIEDVYLLLHERRSQGVRAVADALGQVFREGADVLGGSHPAPATTGDDDQVPSLRSVQPIADGSFGS